MPITNTHRVVPARPLIPRRPAATPRLFALIAVLGAGCGPSTGDAGWGGTVDTVGGVEVVRNPTGGLWDSSETWHIVQRGRIGRAQGDGPDLFGNIRAVEVDAAGRLYVLEAQAREIRVFDADGGFVRRFGRAGAGPGEFENPTGLFWGPEGRLWVADPGNARYSVFDTAGVYLTAYRRPAGFFRLPFPGGFAADGRLVDVGLDAGSGEETLLALRPGAETAPDTIPLPSFRPEQFQIPEVMTTVVPFSPRLVWHFDPRGFLWHGITRPYRIVQQRLGGDTLRIIDRPFESLPVAEEEKTRAIENLAWFTRQGGKADRRRIPDEKPAWQGLFTDDRGYLWVRPTVPAEERERSFDVFDPQGRYLGRARSEFAVWQYRPVVVRGTRLYALTTDEDAVQYVVRAEIVGRE